MKVAGCWLTNDPPNHLWKFVAKIYFRQFASFVAKKSRIFNATAQRKNGSGLAAILSHEHLFNGVGEIDGILRRGTRKIPARKP